MATVKITKKELMQQVVDLYVEYMGFTVQGVDGIVSMNKSQLETEVKEIKRALRFKRYAQKIRVDPIKAYFAKSDSDEGIAFRRRQIIEAMANELWHKNNYQQAKLDVRAKFR